MWRRQLSRCCSDTARSADRDDPHAKSDADADGSWHPHADAHPSDAHAEADSDAHSHAEADCDAYAYAEADGDTDTHAHAGTDGDTDAYPATELRACATCAHGASDGTLASLSANARSNTDANRPRPLATRVPSIRPGLHELPVIGSHGYPASASVGIRSNPTATSIQPHQRVEHKWRRPDDSHRGRL